jgi:hydrogenase maturation protease
LRSRICTSWVKRRRKLVKNSMDHGIDQKSTLILGLGNLLLRDEGFGVHVIQQLKTYRLPSNIKVVEGGVGGYNLLGCMAGIERLLVVDSMMTDTIPGKLVLFKPGPHFKDNGQNALSFHQVGIMELVQISKLLDHYPEVLFLVTRPKILKPGLNLSRCLQKSVGPAVQMILKLCHSQFSELERSTELCTQ